MSLMGNSQNRQTENCGLTDFIFRVEYRPIMNNLSAYFAMTMTTTTSGIRRESLVLGMK